VVANSPSARLKPGRAGVFRPTLASVPRDLPATLVAALPAPTSVDELLRERLRLLACNTFSLRVSLNRGDPAQGRTRVRDERLRLAAKPARSTCRRRIRLGFGALRVTESVPGLDW